MFICADSRKMVDFMPWKWFQRPLLSNTKKRKSSWTKEISWSNWEINLTLLNSIMHFKPRSILYLLWSILKVESCLIWSKDLEKWIKKQQDFTLPKFFSGCSKFTIIILFTETSSHKTLWLTLTATPISPTLVWPNPTFPQSMIVPTHSVVVQNTCLLKWSWKMDILYLLTFTALELYYMNLWQVFRLFTIQIHNQSMKEH